MKVDPAWAHRRLLLRAGNELGPKALGRLNTVFDTDEPTNEISAAWGVKELLRQMLAAHGPNRYSRHETSTRRTRFLAACVDADMPEATRLAGTIEKWWARDRRVPSARQHQRPDRTSADDGHTIG
jgi:transposase